MALLELSVAFLALTPGLQATPHVGQSVNVAIIGSPQVLNGGVLPTTGPAGELGDFNFSNLAPAAVNAASLAPFDTAVLNVASPQMGETTATLPPPAKADLIAWVGSGRKLIIYDSECPAADYSWLPFPFTTNNPGAMGARGTLTIVEENTLSTSPPGDPHFIDVAYLGTFTDAVGDMNVMVTHDPNWYLDMSGTNVLGVSGPVHTYAKYPAGTDKGLIIYNGLDVDYLNNFYPPTPQSAQLRKIWLQELQQPFNPSGLAGGVTVLGITLSPATATNEVGQNHTVTATLTDLLGSPQPGIDVTFNVTAGPNVGLTGTGTSDASGQVTFTYTSSLAGIDLIEASFTNEAGEVIPSNAVTKEWIITNQPPVAVALVNGQKEVTVEQASHAGTEVTLDGTQSSDPDGDLLTYEWDFYSDGTYDATGPVIANTYNLGGPYTATLRVTDPDGASATDTVKITVIDTTPPVIANLVVNPDFLWPPNHQMWPITITADVTDVCDPEPVFRIVGVTSNEPENGLGDGDMAPDWGIFGDLDLLLRAERAGPLNSRVYTIEFMAIDVSGNTATATATVVVPKNMKK